MKKFLVMIMASAVLVACSQNAGKKEGVVASGSAGGENTAGVNEPAGKTSSMMPADPDKVIPAVAEKYSGILVAVVNKTDNSKKEVAVPFGQRTAIEGTPIAIEVLSLFPNFTMANGGYVNVSMDEENPGSKVKIYKDGNEVFTGWLFQNFPGQHGMDDPQFDVFMINSVLK